MPEFVIWSTLALIIIVLSAVITILYSYLLGARRRADIAEEVADQKLQDALLRASEQLKKAEARIRADAIKRSTAVVKGKVAEQLVPFGPEFDYNPRDCRFLGGPVDFVIFDGLTEGHLERVVFIEVKTGRSRLSRRERQVQVVIEAAEVDYEVIHLGGGDEQGN